MFFSDFSIEDKRNVLQSMNLPILCRMSQVDSKIMELSISIIVEKSKLYLREKYNSYYEEEEALRRDNPNHPPSLLKDALLSGSNNYAHSIKIYTSRVEYDIKKIIKYFPDSINYCPFQGMSLLTLACANKDIPKEIIEFLFQNMSSEYL